MPPMTDNQRESAIREASKALRREFPNMYDKQIRAMAESRIDSQGHLRGKFRRV
jgi:hypothetical protein